MKKDTLTELKKRKWKREKIKGELGCEFVKINPDKNDYDEYFQFGKIFNRGNE